MMRKRAKRNYEIGLIIGLILIGVVFLFIVAHFQGYDLTVKVEKDTSVYDYLPDGNYGEHRYLRVGNYNGGKVRSYYLFNLSSLPSGWTEIEITVNFDYGSDMVDVAANLTYETWDEMTITWNNQPTESVYRGHILCDGFDFRIPLRSDQIINDCVSVCLYGKGGEGDGYIQGYSKEGASQNNDIAWISLSYQGIDPGIWNGLTMVGIVIAIVFGILGVIFLIAFIELSSKRVEKRREKRNERNLFNADWLNANINPPIIDVNELPPVREAIEPPIIPTFHRKSTATLEKEINQYITLKLEHGRTHIYVNGRRFIQCIHLILNIPTENVPLYDEIDSVDEAAKVYRTHAHMIPGTHHITPEQEFWGHCSNIQAWVEHDYDTRILMSNISFPLLRELTKVGDPKAKQIYKEEIALRLESGYPSVVQYLLTQGYLQVFSPEEFQSIIETTDLIKNAAANPRIMSTFLRSCVFKFPSLLEVILLQLFKLPNGKKIILSTIEIDPRIAKFRFSLLFRNPEFLNTLKFALENIFKRVDENTRNDILECIKLIEKNQEGKESYLRSNIYRDRYGAMRKLNMDGHGLNLINDAEVNLRIRKAIGDIRRQQSRCSYCGKIIPKDQDICDWCGHRRDDDEGFFPYPFIRKPPGGGGGSTKGTIVALAKVRT